MKRCEGEERETYKDVSFYSIFSRLFFMFIIAMACKKGCPRSQIPRRRTSALREYSMFLIAQATWHASAHPLHPLRPYYTAGMLLKIQKIDFCRYKLPYLYSQRVSKRKLRVVPSSKHVKTILTPTWTRLLQTQLNCKLQGHTGR